MAVNPWYTSGTKKSEAKTKDIHDTIHQIL